MSSKVLIVSRSFKPPIRIFTISDEEASELAEYYGDLKGKPDTFFWPTEFHGEVTQKFGDRPEYYKQFGLPGHEGLDMRATMESKVFACFPGTVKYINTRIDAAAYGVHIRVEGLVDGKKHSIIYAHLMKLVVGTRVGDWVGRGQFIAYANNTGNSDGSHLHITLKKHGATASGETNYPHDIIDPTPRFPQIK